MSLTIDKKTNNATTTVFLAGRLDTTTAPDLENSLSDLSLVKELILDFSKLEYISSAGLRVILKLQKTMNTQGNMKIMGVSDTIMEVFDITGFIDILTIE